MNRQGVGMVVASATAIVVLGGCGDDATDVLAQGEDVELVGEEDLGGQTLDVSAEDEGGTVTGEIRFTDGEGEVVVTVECAETGTDGVVVLGGAITESTDDLEGLAALFIEEGEPDRVAVWFDEGENGSCSELLRNRADVVDDEPLFVDVESDSDIDTD